jgi:tRNA(Ile2) C34 agmatinyltransferase TiaS
MEYHIYHIPNVKIGCSTNPKLRVERQGYIDFEILETHTDIDIVSKRELELQKEYGYKIDNTPYSQSYEWASSGRNGHTAESYRKWFEGSKKWKQENKELHQQFAIAGGKVTGPKLAKRNVESGWISNLGKKMSEKNNQLQTCPHCGITTKGIGYHRWHGDRCKNKK